MKRWEEILFYILLIAFRGAESCAFLEKYFFQNSFFFNAVLYWTEVFSPFFWNYINIYPLILLLSSEKLSVYLVFLLEFSTGKIFCWSIVSLGAGISDTDR